MSPPIRKPPVVLTPVDPKTDPVLSRQSGVAKAYGAGVAERAATARAERPKIGDLTQADAAYKPGRDGPMTIGQITESQRLARAGGPEGKGGLSPASVQGLAAIAQATKEAQLKKEKTMPNDQSQPQPPQPAPEQPKQPLPEAESKEKTKEAVARKVNDLDDLELEQIMRHIQQDVINNTKERDHVADPKNKRISEIDFADGVATGEFKQWVEVIPTKLRVQYRTVTAMEMQAIRLWLFNMTTKDPRMDRLAGEIFGLAVLVASVVQINSDRKPSHLSQDGQGTYGAEFDEQAFEQKYKIFARMPQPLLHAIGTHGQWFDIRVREIFTSDYVKNG